MTDPAEPLEDLASGRLFRFADWPAPEVPQAPGLYTIWDGDQFLYVGMAGRGSGTRPMLHGRLNSHAAGRRGGDQLCIYVCDRLIVPRLSRDQLVQVGDGLLLLEAMTRVYIRERLSFRFRVTNDGQEAHSREQDQEAGPAAIRKAAPQSGQPARLGRRTVRTHVPNTRSTCRLGSPSRESAGIPAGCSRAHLMARRPSVPNVASSSVLPYRCKAATSRRFLETGPAFAARSVSQEV